jgi:hypothetical protein
MPLEDGPAAAAYLAAGVCSGAGAGAGAVADVSAAFGSFGAIALSGQPMTDKDNNTRETAMTTDKLFFTFPTSFFKLTFTHKILEI